MDARRTGAADRGRRARDRRDPAGAFRRWCRERCARPLPLDGDLVDSVLVPLGDGRTGWYLNQHHLVADAWSTVLLFRQVAAQYEALSAVRRRGAAAAAVLLSRPWRRCRRGAALRTRAPSALGGAPAAAGRSAPLYGATRVADGHREHAH